jgi:hypothetical protein
MKIQSIIHKILKSEKFSEDKYNWNINHSKLPYGILVVGNGNFEENVDLKYKLHQTWVKSCCKKEDNTLFELSKYYVSTWGGVHRNSRATLNRYILSNPEKLIDSQKEKGIASWSKILCIRNPDKYAIFDARVSFALNAIQILSYTDTDPEDFIRFPDLPSRNSKIKELKPKLQKYFEKNKIPKAEDFYRKYLEILESVNFKGYKICELEMLLFSSTEALSEDLKGKI